MNPEEALQNLLDQQLPIAGRIEAFDQLSTNSDPSLQENFKSGLRRILAEEADNYRLRQRTIYKLGDLKDQQAGPILEHLITDPYSSSEIEKTAAVVALSQIDGHKALPIVTHILATDPLESMRRSAAIGLGYIKDKRALEALLEALKSENSVDVLEFIAASLGSLGYTEAVEPLIKALEQHKKRM